METLGVEALQRTASEALSVVGAEVTRFLPRLLGALAALGLGWGVARLVGGLAARVAARAGLDRATARLGIDETLRGAGLPGEGSWLVGALAFWIVGLTSALAAAEILGLAGVTATIDRLVAFLPDLMTAGVIVVLGSLLARMAGDGLGARAATAGMAFARPLGRSVRGVLLVAVAVVAMGQIGIDTTILLWGLITLAGAVSFALALAFALGSREVVRGILAGYYLRRSLRERDDVLIDGRRGRLDRIGPVHSVFVSDEGSFSVPNAELIAMRFERPRKQAH
ncbi:MAG: hypothetical protein R3F35_05915 [Myxococcota bacterium]